MPFDVVEAIEELVLAEKGRKPKAKDGDPGAGVGAHAAAKPRSTKKMLLDAECASVPDPGHGVPVPLSPISTVQWRQRAAVEGRIRSVAVSPVKGSPALEAEL